jgi:hypothetical protein
MPDPAGLEALRFCSFCPNLCRSAWPADALPQTESVTPSALARLAVAVALGRIAADPAAVAALRRTAMAAACRPACPYGHPIAALVDAVATSLEA